MNFSQRVGLEPSSKPFQKDSMDSFLRNSLWNAFSICVVSDIQQEWHIDGGETRRGETAKLFGSLWLEFYKFQIDTLPAMPSQALATVRNWFFNEKQTSWHKVYDFVEFVANIRFQYCGKRFVQFCNQMLEREFSAFRFVGTRLAPITNESEIAAIEQAASIDDSMFASVSIHIQSALKHLSDRKNPDYRNSMKESISAIEALCKLIAKKDTTTLGPALDSVAAKTPLHPKLKEAFKALYSYTCDTHGIRHALKDDTQPEAEDATFMLVSCSAFVNYLIEKARKSALLPS
jgi:AbiJ N-terminal domain 4